MKNEDQKLGIAGGNVDIDVFASMIAEQQGEIAAAC